MNSVASEILTGLRRHPGWELGREFDKISDEEVSAIECFVDEGIIKDVYMECGILWMSEIEVLIVTCHCGGDLSNHK